MKACLHCKTPFEPKKPKAKFCSAKCRVYFSRALKGRKPEKKAPVLPDSMTEFMGNQIPQELSGLQLAVWKNNIKVAAKTKK